MSTAQQVLDGEVMPPVQNFREERKKPQVKASPTSYGFRGQQRRNANAAPQIVAGTTMPLHSRTQLFFWDSVH
jgi:hypothetical protein